MGDRTTRSHIKCQDNNLHIYPQYAQHCEAAIVGTRPALAALRDAIDRVLKTDEPQVSAHYVADGEGFNNIIIPLCDEDKWRYMQLPYTADYIGDAGVGWHELFSKKTYKDLFEQGVKQLSDEEGPSDNTDVIADV